MLASERRQKILEKVRSERAVSVAELRENFNVSDMTIRRDLRMLSNDGLLRRVHGGAIFRYGKSYEPSFLVRASVNIAEKKAIGHVAASIIHEDESISLDVGTTTLEIAKNLIGTPDLTIITSNLRIASVLAEAMEIRLILTGGIVRQTELSMIGHIAESSYKDFRVDKAFIGVGGLHLENGLSEYNLEDALVKRTMLEHAEQVIVVADSSKLGRTCLAHIAPLTAIDTLITDWNIPTETCDDLRARGIEVIVAAPLEEV